MRREPMAIDRIAREAAAQMIVDAALRDMVERDDDRVLQGGGLEPLPAAPEQGEDRHLREFGRVADPALDAVDLLDETERRLIDERERHARAAGRLGETRERGRERGDVLRDLRALVAIGLGDGLEHVGKAGPAEPRRRREIGPAPERLGVGREEHGERPAALLAHRMDRLHVDGVEIGPLFAIDLDADEERVHERRDRRILEALMRHDVAPVAGGIADRQQDRLVLGLGGGERRRAPGLPMHRVVLVLQQIGAGLAAERVAHVRKTPPCELTPASYRDHIGSPGRGKTPSPRRERWGEGVSDGRFTACPRTRRRARPEPRAAAVARQGGRDRALRPVARRAYGGRISLAVSGWFWSM